ncbi:protease inhibitor I42 family protein [Streptomyces sp. NPDC102360]|uniref:protease inhibitor I42 family protein n=1 Tax=Streptomyces sp. NPDC102360 TaxID=3366160 RepID=UPI0037FC1DAC
MGEVHLSADDSEVTVRRGDEVVVRLPENGTSGHQWQVRDIGGGLEVAGSDFLPPDALVPGAGGTRVLRLRPTKAGDGHLTLHLKQPWSDDVAEEYALRVTVE